jgi:DNA-binding CsgD family transcriptional regulator
VRGDGTLFDREAELGAIEDAICGERTGASFVYVEGHPGIGKTSLLEVTRARAEARDLRVIFACGEELERDFSFGVVRQLFERVLAAATPADRGRLLDGPAAHAAVAIGVDPSPPFDRAQPDSPFPVVHALYWLTANLGAREPLVLMLDDAHWADAPSLRFLDYLAARIEGMAVSVVLAARPLEPVGSGPDTSTEVLARIRARRGSLLVRPEPFGAETTVAILEQRFDATPDPRFAAACQEASAGNPFLLGELIDALLIDEVVPDASAAELVGELGPETVARSLMLRLSRLPTVAGAVTDAVAVLGAQAEVRHVATLTGLSLEEVGRAADALAGVNVLSGARPLRFIHPIVRQAVYAELPPGTRARLHAQAAAALVAEGQPPARVAPHLLVTEPANRQRVVELLRRAASEALAQGAADLAQTYLERALAEPPDEDGLPDVLADLGLADATVGTDLGRASRHLEAAAEMTADPAARATRVEIAARVRLYGGDLSGAAGLLGREREALDSTDGDLALRLLAHQAAIGLLQPPIAEDAVSRLEDHAELRGETAAERAVLAELAGKRWLEGRIGEASELARRAIANGCLLAAEGSASVAFNHAVAVLIDADRYDDATPALDAGIALAREEGSLLGIASLIGLRVVAAWRRGDLSDAEANARSALELLDVSSTPVFDPAHWAYLAAVLTERGQLDEAEEAIARSGCGPDLPRLTYMGMPFFARARLRLVQGRPHDALDDLLELRSREDALGVRHMRTPWRREAVEASMALGDRDGALVFAEDQLELTGRWDTPWARGVALATKGLAARGQEGIDLLEEGAALLARSPARLDHARALVDLGSALRRGGRRAEARGPLGAGLDAARRCGAMALAARAHEELVTAGAKPRRLSFSGVESLTASERRIATMAARGQSNREIAAALFITVRTVENHLGRTYRKLAIGSRRELAASLEPEA